jgi:hypothetical protein
MIWIFIALLMPAFLYAAFLGWPILWKILPRQSAILEAIAISVDEKSSGSVYAVISGHVEVVTERGEKVSRRLVQLVRRNGSDKKIHELYALVGAEVVVHPFAFGDAIVDHRSLRDSAPLRYLPSFVTGLPLLELATRELSGYSLLFEIVARVASFLA